VEKNDHANEKGGIRNNYVCVTKLIINFDLGWEMGVYDLNNELLLAWIEAYVLCLNV